ncbi:hypothetical protein F4677DRAFT_355837 [Hypoxylon crocopeplum]|nr:hypothetical protein F4677DRAFT_355837 [Hypoxylon crocopeplum]
MWYKDLSGFTGMSTTYFRLQHDYGLRGFTQAVVWIVVSLHDMIVVAHLSEHVFRKRTCIGIGWSVVGELVALAMKMYAYELLQHGKALEDGMDIWRLRIFGRDRKGSQHPQLLVRKLNTWMASSASGKELGLNAEPVHV